MQLVVYRVKGWQIHDRIVPIATPGLQRVAKRDAHHMILNSSLPTLDENSTGKQHLRGRQRGQIREEGNHLWKVSTRRLHVKHVDPRLPWHHRSTAKSGPPSQISQTGLCSEVRTLNS